MGRTLAAAGALLTGVAALPVALIVLVGALLSTNPAGATGGDGTPLLLGASRLAADQLVAWYRATGHASRSSVDAATLIGLYLDTGARTGVRADLAIAQAVVETGYFEHFPAGAGGTNNYAGIAVYDGQHRGAGFPSAAEGVYAHLALLREYADAGYHDAPVHAAHPGCCPTVGALAGTWATDPAYADQILAVYAAMLASAGLPPDDTTLVSSTGGVGPVFDYLQAQLGKPYQWAAAGPGSFDCSGLTMRAYQTVGIHLPHNAAAQYAMARQPIADPGQLQPGDLLFWAYGSAQSIHHVAVYVGDGQMIEAYATGTPVRVTPVRLKGGYWGATRPLTDPGYNTPGGVT